MEYKRIATASFLISTSTVLTLAFFLGLTRFAAIGHQFTIREVGVREMPLLKVFELLLSFD